MGHEKNIFPFLLIAPTRITFFSFCRFYHFMSKPNPFLHLLSSSSPTCTSLFSPHDINAINLTVIPTCFPFNFTSSSASLPCGAGSSFTQSLFSSSSSSPSLTPDSADNAHRRGKFGDPFVRHRARHRQFSERLSISGEFSACKREQRSDFERIHE